MEIEAVKAKADAINFLNSRCKETGIKAKNLSRIIGVQRSTAWRVLNKGTYTIDHFFNIINELGYTIGFIKNGSKY